MTVTVTPTNLQKLEFNVTTSEGPGRVIILTGVMPVSIEAASGVNPVEPVERSFKAFLDPVFPPGQFRRATATVSFGRAGIEGGGAGGAVNSSIDEVQASLDDESGRVQLVVDLSLQALGGFNRVFVSSLLFQVTMLSQA